MKYVVLMFGDESVWEHADEDADGPDPDRDGQRRGREDDQQQHGAADEPGRVPQVERVGDGEPGEQRCEDGEGEQHQRAPQGRHGRASCRTPFR